MSMQTSVLSRIATAEATACKRYGHWEQSGPLVSVFAGDDLPLSVTWHDGSRPPSAKELLASANFMRQHRQRPRLNLLSHAAPELLPLLGNWGYGLDYVLHVYALDLRAPAAPLPPPAPTLTLRPDTNPTAWAAAAAQGFGGGLEVMQAVAHAPGTQLFTALVGSEVAGTAALSITAGVAALHGMSTLPAFRGRGVQAALLAHRVALAQAQGADHATVFVTPGTASERNIMRGGFQLCGMRLTFALPS